MVAGGWAGNFDCSKCGRKRLEASAFSKKMIEKRTKDPEASLRCKSCIEEASQKERDQAAERAAARAAGADDAGSSGNADKAAYTCAACEQELGAASFSAKQLAKGATKQRCRSCVEVAEAAEAGAGEARRVARLAEAAESLRAAEAVGDKAAVLAASSRVAAIEAEGVTGLRPVVLGRGRRGGRAGRGAGRIGGRT
eukprot:349632-Chlamydomonas_euryale.AAC.46